MISKILLTFFAMCGYNVLAQRWYSPAGGLGSRLSPDASGAIIGLHHERLCLSAAIITVSSKRRHRFLSCWVGRIMPIENDYIKHLIANYETNIMGNRYIFVLENEETLSFCIKKEDVPHLMGIRKLNIRQVKNSSALAIYNKLKNGAISLKHVGYYKESYKKVVNFERMINVLAEGEIVKIVKRIGSIKSNYLIYLDNRPDEILHLGVVKDATGKWHPETFLVIKKRNVSAYIDDQIPVEILERYVIKDGREDKKTAEFFEYMI